MNVPELRFPEFNGEWEEKKLENVSKVNDGTHFTPQYQENGVPFFSVETVASNVNHKFISKNDHEKLIKRCNPQKGDILLTRIGTLAKSKLVDWNYEFSIYVSLALVKPNGFVNSSFLNQYFKSEYYKKDFLRKSLLLATPKKINIIDLKKTNVSITSVQEQEKIASFLSKVDEKIEKLEKKQELWKTYKKGIMQLIFSQKLRFKDENGTDYPDWEYKFIDNIFDVGRGEVIAKTKLKEIPDSNYCFPVYSSQTQNRGIMGYYKNFDFDGDFLTWTTDGAKAGKVMHRNGKFKCSNVCGVLKAKNEFEGVANPCTAEILDSITHKYVSYVGNPKLMNNVMAKIKIKVPKVSEQKKIANLIIVIDSKIDLIEEELKVYNKFKKGLLQKMLC